MANALKLNLPSADSLFSTQEERDDARLERVMNLSLSEVSDFPNHPFKVRMDDEMREMSESVKQYGVLVPGLARPKEGGGYEIVAGHRRKTASELAGRDTMPFIVRELTDDEATIIMVDSNLQREKILPSEKAFAYKMKLDAMRRQGQRSDLTCYPSDNKLAGKKSLAIVGESSGDSQATVFRFTRLTELIPEMLEMVDNAAMGEKGKPQMALRPAVELSYLPQEEQRTLCEAIASEEGTPSHVQAMKMRKFSEQGQLNEGVILSIMQEEKPNQAEQFKLPREKISRFFAPDASAEKIENDIIKGLELLARQRERQRGDAR